MSWLQDTTSLNLLWHIKMLNQEKKQCGCFFCLSASVYEREVFQCATHLVFFLSWMQINCRASRTKTGFYSVSPSTMWLLTYPRNKPSSVILQWFKAYKFSCIIRFSCVDFRCWSWCKSCHLAANLGTSVKCPMRPEPDRNEGAFWRDDRVGKTASEIRLKWLLKQKNKQKECRIML